MLWHFTPPSTSSFEQPRRGSERSSNSPWASVVQDAFKPSTLAFAKPQTTRKRPRKGSPSPRLQEEGLLSPLAQTQSSVALGGGWAAGDEEPRVADGGRRGLRDEGRRRSLRDTPGRSPLLPSQGWAHPGSGRLEARAGLLEEGHLQTLGNLAGASSFQNGRSNADGAILPGSLGSASSSRAAPGADVGPSAPWRVEARNCAARRPRCMGACLTLRIAVKARYP